LGVVWGTFFWDIFFSPSTKSQLVVLWPRDEAQQTARAHSSPDSTAGPLPACPTCLILRAHARGSSASVHPVPQPRVCPALRALSHPQLLILLLSSATLCLLHRLTARDGCCRSLWLVRSWSLGCLAAYVQVLVATMRAPGPDRGETKYWVDCSVGVSAMAQLRRATCKCTSLANRQPSHASICPEERTTLSLTVYTGPRSVDVCVCVYVFVSLCVCVCVCVCVCGKSDAATCKCQLPAPNFQHPTCQETR